MPNIVVDIAGASIWYPFQKHIVRTSDGTIHVLIRRTGYITHCYSRDGGRNWSYVDIWEESKDCAIDKDSNDNLVAAQANGGTVKFKKATYSNGVWTWGDEVELSAGIGADYYYPDIIVDGNGYIHIVASNIGADNKGVWWRSVDGGDTWTRTDITNFQQYCIAIIKDSSNNLYLFGALAGGTTPVRAIKITYSAGPNWSVGAIVDCSTGNRFGVSLHILPNNKIVFVSAAAATGALYFRKSTNASDITAWDSEIEITSYVNNQYSIGLMVISNNVIRVYWCTKTSNVLYYRESTNGGVSFASGVPVYAVGNNYGPNIAKQIGLTVDYIWLNGTTTIFHSNYGFSKCKEIIEIDDTPYNFSSLTYTKSHPSEDPDTFEIVLSENEPVSYFDKVEIFKTGIIDETGATRTDLEFVGFIEHKKPTKTRNGTQLIISGRCRKVKAWKKFTERFSDSRLTGFFGAVYPDELVKFIARCPVSDDPQSYSRHKIGWGIYPYAPNWVLSSSETDPKTTKDYVRLRRIGFAWKKGSAAFSNVPLVVDDFDFAEEQWSKLGLEYPHLDTDDDDTNALQGITIGCSDSYYSFANLAAIYNGSNITQAILNIKAKNYIHAGAGADVTIRIYLDVGAGEINVGELTWTNAEVVYSVKTIDVSATVNTFDKLQACRMRIVYQTGTAPNGDYSYPNVTYAYLSVSGSKSSDQIAEDYFKIDMGSSRTDLVGILIESRKSDDKYARNYVIETSPNDVDWTIRATKNDNTARDILHSWDPITARYIRIRITADAEFEWEISQIYIYCADNSNYRILDADLTLGTITEFGSTINSINIPFSRANQALKKIVNLTHSAYIPWEWWINHNDGTFNFASRKGSDKSGHVSIVIGSHIGEDTKEGDCRKSVQRVRVVGKGEGKKQDDVTSDWYVSAAGIAEAGTFYEEIISDKQISSKTVADVEAQIYLEENRGIPYEITVKITNNVFWIGSTEDAGVDIGDDVMVTDADTGLSGIYRIHSITKTYDGNGEIVTITLVNRWKDFSDRWASVRRTLRELGLGGTTIEDWFAEGSRQGEIDETKIGDLWGVKANYQETQEGKETDTTKYETYGLADGGTAIEIKVDKFEIRGRTDVGGPTTTGLYNQNVVTNWSNHPRFTCEVEVPDDHTWKNGDYAYFYMYDSAGAGDDKFGFKIILTGGDYLLYALLADNGGTNELVLLDVIFNYGEKYRLEARVDWSDKVVMYYVNGELKAVLSFSDEIVNSSLNTMHANLTSTQPDPASGQSYLRFWTWKSQYLYL